MRKLAWLIVLLGVAACDTEQKDFREATIAELHDEMQRGELRSEQLVGWYLDRIEDLDSSPDGLNAMLEINPDALLIARSLDEEWAASGPRGPLHGIPVVLKGNIDTADRMRTTAGSLALANHVPPEDAFVVKRLRDAGMVILGKANLSEWANFRSSRSSSGWSSVGGQTRNPYDPTRNPCGSSSGSAVVVAANLTMAAVGTETDGSVVCPSGMNGIVGIKPTLGLVSRTGIVPIAHSQDTAGPMARTVRDAALLLSAMTGQDKEDSATMPVPDVDVDYAANLAADGLAGKRIGVVRSFFGAGSNPRVTQVLDDSILAIRSQGAEVVDDIDIDLSDIGAAESTVLHYEFKADLAVYLERSNAPLRSLADIIDFNEANADKVMPFFGQDLMLESEQKGGLDSEEYLDALDTGRRLTRARLDAALDENDLDALIAITNGPAWKTDHVKGDHFRISSSSLAAVSGYPNVTVPAGFVFDLPVGLSFIGRPFGEQDLLEIAYAFEQATGARRPPAQGNDVTFSD